MNEYKCTFTNNATERTDAAPLKVVVCIMAASDADARNVLYRKYLIAEIESVELVNRGVCPHDLTSGMCQT